MNTQGTQATAAGQTTLNNTMAAVLNTQGTQATAAGQTTGNAYLLTLATNSALQATAANQQIQITQQASTIRTYGASGTAASSSQTVLMGLDPSSVSTDSFGRLRVSTPDYRFDGQLTYDIPTDLWDKAFNSTGTITYDSTNRMAALTCAAGGTAVLQSHKYAPYTPGRSQLALVTFIMGATPNANVSRRAGYFDGTNGIYLEQTSTGVQLVLASTTGNGTQTVPQNSWNIDKLNGSGPSGLILDLSKVQILAISLQALYAGRVIVGFDINGILWPVHAFVHANLITTPYIANASLPVRYEVRSTGASSGTLSALCASVMSEGGNNLAAIPGRTFAAARTTVLQVNARLPLLSIRAKAFYNSLPNTGIILANTFSASSSAQPIYLELVRNATLTAAAWANVDANSTAEFDVTASALAGGSTVYGVVIGSGAGATQMPIDANLLDRLVIAATPLLNTQDILTICATSLAGNTNVGCAMTWKEVR